MIPPKTATLAQLAEHPICNRKVVGSIPMGGSNLKVSSSKREIPTSVC
jgi:hypothetical protein